eukprot:1495003-Rhodomonas_salina.1
MLKAGKDHLHIKEVDRRLVMQLETAQKAFTTVKDLCEHLHICTLTSIVKDLAHSDIAEANAWRMADNHLLALKVTSSTSVFPMTIQGFGQSPLPSPLLRNTLSRCQRRSSLLQQHWQ